MRQSTTSTGRSRRRSAAGQRRGFAALVLLLFLLAPHDSSGQAPPGRIRFRGTTAVGSSEGEFPRWEIWRAVIDEERPERSEVEVVVDLTSLDTGNTTRDRHLKSSDFLGVSEYPRATAKLTGFTLEDAEHLTAQVELDLHSHRHSFPMRFTIVDRDTRRIVGEVKLDRTAYDIGPTGWRNPLRVGNEIAVNIEAVVPRPSVGAEDTTRAKGFASTARIDRRARGMLSDRRCRFSGSGAARTPEPSAERECSSR